MESNVGSVVYTFSSLVMAQLFDVCKLQSFNHDAYIISSSEDCLRSSIRLMHMSTLLEDSEKVAGKVLERCDMPTTMIILAVLLKVSLVFLHSGHSTQLSGKPACSIFV